MADVSEADADWVNVTDGARIHVTSIAYVGSRSNSSVADDKCAKGQW